MAIASVLVAFWCVAEYGMYNKFRAHRGKRDALVQQLLRAADLMQSVEECRLYVVNEARESDDEVWVTELWADEAAHRRSLELPGVRELVAETMQLLDGPPEQIQLRAVGGLTGRSQN